MIVVLQKNSAQLLQYTKTDERLSGTVDASKARLAG